MKIKLICFSQTSGSLYLTVGDKTCELLLERGIYLDRVVGVTYINESDKLFIEQTKLFKTTHLQYAPDETVMDKDNPKFNTAPAKLLNPLGLTDYEIQLLENAKIVDPAICDLIKENIVAVCKKKLDIEILPPKVKPEVVDKNVEIQPATKSIKSRK